MTEKDRGEFTIAAAGVPVRVRRKRVKNLNLRVSATGEVQLSIPLACPLSEAERFLAAREGWIARNLARVHGRPDPSAACRYADGDATYLWGRPLGVRVEEARGTRSGFRLDREAGILTLVVPRGLLGDDDEAIGHRRGLVRRARKAEVVAALPGLSDRCGRRVGVTCDDWRVRDMRTRWGSCAIARRRIWLASELATRDPECLEAVACHELCHLIVPDHSEAFYRELTRSFPDWRRVRAELRRQPRLP